MCMEKEIIWIDNDDTINMKNYIEYISAIDIYNDINTRLNITWESYKTMKIVGICEMNKYLKFEKEGCEDLMYILKDDKGKKYISIGRCHPIFWYKYDTKRFSDIYNIYNQESYSTDFNGNQQSAFIGNEEMLGLTIHELENHLIFHKYSEKLIWGSKWDDYPFRDCFMNNSVSYIDSIIYTGQSMRQISDDYYTVSVRTNYSKSIITINNFPDAYIINIKYNPIINHRIDNINKLITRNYKSDLPMDIIILLLNFPFMTSNTINHTKPFTEFNFYLLSLLIPEQSELKQLLEAKKDIDKDLKNKMLAYFEKT